MSRLLVKRDAVQCAAFSSAITLTRGTVLELCTTWLSKLRLAGGVVSRSRAKVPKCICTNHVFLMSIPVYGDAFLVGDVLSPSCAAE